MLIALIALPLIAALASWFIPLDVPRRCLLVSTAALELLLALSCWVWPPMSIPPNGFLLCLDTIGLVVLTLICTLFLAVSVYALGYLRVESAEAHRYSLQGLRFSNAPEATFTACLLLFLASAVLTACTQHFGLLWIGIETTTLVSAPLIYFHRHRRSLEATWKYLIICSVGIAFALVGNLLLDISMQSGGNMAVEMSLSPLLGAAKGLHSGWFKAAFVFLLVGYGTKMGVAPMHTWLPDTHSEAPLISALLSGALLNCAFLGIFRAYQVALAAQMGEFAATLLMAFGLFSMLTAALFIVGQGDFKRMLAYSSVEHMGILLLGLGLTHGLTHGLTLGMATGNTAAPMGAAGGLVALESSRGWVLHMINHSLLKASLFMLAGNIFTKYSTKSMHDVTGLGRTLPVTGTLWMVGTLALLGTPPFAMFSSEFSILQGLLLQGHTTIAIIYLILLGVIFVGTITPVLRMCRGKAPHGIFPTTREEPVRIWPAMVLIFMVLILGLVMPDWLKHILQSAAQLGMAGK